MTKPNVDAADVYSLGQIHALIDADRAAADAEIARLREALIEVAATLSWQAFGDCRAFDQFGKSGPVLPSHAAESLAKDVLKGAAE